MKTGKILRVIVACRLGTTTRLTLLPKKRSPHPPFFINTKKLSKSLVNSLSNRQDIQIFLLIVQWMFSKINQARCTREKFDLKNLVARGEGQTRFTDLAGLAAVAPKEIRFPVDFLRNIVKWFAQLTWGHPFDDCWGCITWVELYVDFVLCAKMLAPVRLPSTNSKKAGSFVERTHGLGAHLNPLLGVDAFTFASAIKFLDRKKIRFAETCTQGEHVIYVGSCWKICGDQSPA